MPYRYPLIEPIPYRLPYPFQIGCYYEKITCYYETRPGALVSARPNPYSHANPKVGTTIKSPIKSKKFRKA